MKNNINKGHWHEVADRTSIIQHNIEDFLAGNPAVKSNRKLRKIIEKAQKQLGKLYQESAKKF